MSPALLFRLAWGLWALSWFAAALWSAPTVKRPAPGASLLYRSLIALGVILLFAPTSRWLQAERLWHVGYGGAILLGGLTIPCFMFTWWARLHLGRLWSGSVTRKENHRVVDTGPYALVRHPIYTGLLGATLATAVAEATAPALLAFLLITLGFFLKARLEEGFLRSELGDAYDSYRRRVPMLLPFGPKAA